MTRKLWCHHSIPNVICCIYASLATVCLQFFVSCHFIWGRKFHVCASWIIVTISLWIRITEAKISLMFDVLVISFLARMHLTFKFEVNWDTVFSGLTADWRIYKEAFEDLFGFPWRMQQPEKFINNNMVFEQMTQHLLSIALQYLSTIGNWFIWWNIKGKDLVSCPCSLWSLRN